MRLAKLSSFIARVPLFLLIFILVALPAVVYSLLQSTYSFTTAFGNISMLISLVLLALGWAIHLKNDGIRIFSHKKQTGNPPESWADRTQGFGAPPATPYPIPPEGVSPDSVEYERLAAAELALRKKIMGYDNSSDKNADANKDQDLQDKKPKMEMFKRVDARQAQPVKSLALAGFLLFALGVIFQYLIPSNY
ncbi:MAG TPA: hypothetical protein PKJ53_02690 [Spirochaetales bacterium]|nr:hypothetical protein [Spirochaetales bacterium]